ncbi:MAG TPA: CHASE4 domain-containing protein [Steroidobacteraceae bacterium]|nr:CHASE4 domain-containing protein [Steroidobacteraceae bacterium]
MNIRLKVIALVGAIFAILVWAEVLVERHVVMPSFAQLERADAQTAMRRIVYALDRTLTEIGLLATDWGNWADTYQFVEDHNPTFIAANISNIALRQLNVNVLMIVDRDGQLVEARDLDLQSDEPLGLELTSQPALPADFPWRANLRAGTAARGLLRTSRGILLLAAAPVLDGHGIGPSRGMVVLGRLLSPAVVRTLGYQAQAQLTMLPPDPGTASEQLLESDKLTHVYRAFDDLYGGPVMTLRVDVPREITLRGYRAVTYASACLIAAAVIVLMLLVVVLNRVILNPLAQVTRHAVALGADKDLTTRLDLKRRDEFGVLAREFDRMVERVEESRTQLVDQSFQAGFAELAKGVLHNLGNAMTPISVRLASLTDRLRSAPIADAEQAVAELKQGSAGAERSADLEEFLRLACKELAATVRSAQEDVATITRQTSLIQGVLAEQMRSARNEHVIEPVRLTELLAQSLEIVPDSCRARLSIHADDTVRGVGVVRVARTVLRLILQNLIINAADAVRDAGKDKGRLRLSAEIVQKADGRQLHLQCIDDGIGIPVENLERVFENGFTTKSPETNHGIGLHWCANAIGALGGRIWAASDGPGSGAALHLLVPLNARETAPAAGAA